MPSEAPVAAEAVLAGAAWRRIGWRLGTKGPLAAEFAALRVRPAEGAQLRDGWRLPGDEVRLVGEHRASGERKYYLANLDSTGLKLCGANEWLAEKHGTRTRRSWRKLHLGVDAATGRIAASALTGREVDDGAQAGPSLERVAGALASFTGDGGYDQDRVHDSVVERRPEAAVIVPPRATAVPSGTAETEPTQRDRRLRHIVEHGRMAWQKVSGYTKRARAEAAIARWRRVIGDGLRSRTDKRRATEVAVAAHAPSPDPGRSRGYCARAPDPCHGC